MCLPGTALASPIVMTRDTPNPSTRHKTEDWDPAGKSEDEKQATEGKFEEGEQLPKPDKRIQSREDDKEKTE